jgi:hypothetical protein
VEEDSLVVLLYLEEEEYQVVEDGNIWPKYLEEEEYQAVEEDSLVVLLYLEEEEHQVVEDGSMVGHMTLQKFYLGHLEPDESVSKKSVRHL